MAGAAFDHSVNDLDHERPKLRGASTVLGSGTSAVKLWASCVR